MLCHISNVCHHIDVMMIPEDTNFYFTHRFWDLLKVVTAIEV